MNAIHALQPLYSTVGFAIGLLVGLTGVGGGSLMTPILILLFGIYPATAVGTDLLYAAVTKTAGSLVHGLNRTIDWRVVRRLAAGSVPMTVMTMAALGHFDINGPVVRELTTVVLTIALFVAAATLVFRDKIVARYARRIGALRPKQVAVITVSVGAVLGVLVSVSSVGAGACGVTALILLYPQLPTARIVGSDIAHAVPLTLAAGIGHWLLGSVDLDVLASLLLGSVPGILLGSFAAARIPETALRLVLAGTLVVVATKLSLDMRPSISSNSGSVAAITTPQR
ncbi:MAG: sulfite exporter TauE/SafE family protein [Xanthobacteraceae bacterium]